MSVRDMAFLGSLRKHFHAYAGTIIALLIIGIVGLLSLSWFRGNYLISAVDFSMPFDRIKSFIANFYSWDPRSLGSANPRILAFTFPVWTYFAFSEVIGLSLVNAEKILFYGIFTISGLSMYYLTTTLLNTKSSNFKSLAGLISGLFYMLNPYVALNILPLRQVAYIIYALLPLFLGIFAKCLNEKRNVRSAIIVAIVMLLATSAFADPSFVPLIFLPLLMYLIFFIMTTPEKTVIYSAFKFILLFFIIWLLLNFYWLIPDLYSYSSELGKVASAYTSVGVSFQSIVQLGSAPILGAIRLLGLWSLNSGYKGAPYVIWAPVYQNPFLIVIGFLIPILAFIPVLLKPRDKHVIFFACFAVVSLTLINGSYSPLGNWIYSYVPLFGALFNTPYLRFGMYLTTAYAFLIGYALAELFNRLTLHLKKTRCLRRKIISGIPLVFLLFLILGVYAFPLWTGEVIYPGNEILASNRYKIPSYYYDAASWLGAQHEEFNIFSLPYSIIGYAAYTWEPKGYSGPDPTTEILNMPVVSSTSGGGIGTYIARSIVNNSTGELAKILALMNVKYVLFHGDSNWQLLEGNGMYISTSSENFQSILNSQSGLYLEKSFGELDFYRNEYWSPMDIYAATNNILVDGNLSQLIPIAQRNNFEPSESVLLFSDQLSASQVSTFPMNTTFFQDTDFLNLVLSEVDGSITTSLNDKPTYVQNGAITINTTIAVDTPQESTIWLEMPSTSNQEKLSITLDGTIIANESELSINSFASSSWTQIGKTYLSKGLHTLTLTVTNGQTLPTRIMFIPDQALNSVFEMLYNSLAQTRIIYSLEPQPLISASYYTGWKGVISTNGQGDPDMLVFPSPTSCPYISSFPLNFTYWNAYNSTLIYITTASSPLTIISISSDGTQTSAYAWWETGTSWETGWPITIPPNQRAIIQVSQQAKTISLQTDSNTITLSVTDGRANPTPTKTPSETSTTVFIPETENYLLAVNVATGYGNGNLSIRIDSKTFTIDANLQEQEPTFTYKYIGPINLTVGYHTISTSGESTATIESMLLYSLKSGENFADANTLLSSNQTNNPSITCQEINPTQYVVHVNTSTSFSLVFSESYDSGWVAYINGQQIPSQYHFTANGYANGWYINKTGTYTITLEFTPQNLFYAGAAISITTLIICTIYISKNKTKIIYQKYLKKTKITAYLTFSEVIEETRKRSFHVLCRLF